MQSLPNTVVSLIPAYGEVNLIQLYTCKIKFVFANLTGRWFSHDTLVSSTNKTYCHDITEILLIVALKHNYPNSIPNLRILKKNCIYIDIKYSEHDAFLE